MPAPYFQTSSRPLLVAADAPTLRAVASNLFSQGMVSRVIGIATVFDWDPASLAVDDGMTVIKPNDIPALSPGRWILSTFGGGGGGGAGGGAPTSANKDMTPLVTAGDDQPTGLTMAATPVGQRFVRVEVNTNSYTVGDGVKTKDCYFSGEGGVTARAFGAIVLGDELYWNGVIAGFDLDARGRGRFDHAIGFLPPLSPAPSPTAA